VILPAFESPLYFAVQLLFTSIWQKNAKHFRLFFMVLSGVGTSQIALFDDCHKSHSLGYGFIISVEGGCLLILAS